MWGECGLPEAWSQGAFSRAFFSAFCPRLPHRGHREEAHCTVFKGHKGMYSLDFMEIGGHRTLMITELGDVSGCFCFLRGRALIFRFAAFPRVCRSSAAAPQAQTEAGVTSVGISLYGRLVAAGSLNTIVRWAGLGIQQAPSGRAKARAFEPSPGTLISIRHALFTCTSQVSPSL
ncbi:hypothetical protein JB92DRAFT_1883196 [Gautieria morchelliformis]|nr:hypothetical protein JB92DRAFT_1883196 [Gautieria morchelliformis]